MHRSTVWYLPRYLCSGSRLPGLATTSACVKIPCNVRVPFERQLPRRCSAARTKMVALFEGSSDWMRNCGIVSCVERSLFPRNAMIFDAPSAVLILHAFSVVLCAFLSSVHSDSCYNSPSSKGIDSFYSIACEVSIRGICPPRTATYT